MCLQHTHTHNHGQIKQKEIKSFFLLSSFVKEQRFFFSTRAIIHKHSKNIYYLSFHCISLYSGRQLLGIHGL